MNGGIVPARARVAASGTLFFLWYLRKELFMELTEVEYLTYGILFACVLVVFCWCVGGETSSDTIGEDMHEDTWES